MEKRKRRQKRCWEIAFSRARQARRQKKTPILVGWIFIAALLSTRSASVIQLAMPCRSAADNDWPISDYERGYSTSPKPHRERYNTQPTMNRLMRDLRRPAARDDATQFLLARIDDVALCGWVVEQIREGQINRLSIHVRPGLSEALIIASWQTELNNKNTAHDETMNDVLKECQSPRLR